METKRARGFFIALETKICDGDISLAIYKLLKLDMYVLKRGTAWWQNIFGQVVKLLVSPSVLVTVLASSCR